jgi:uncharacterized protein involved in type VI secretion and phage assembly
MESLTQTDRLLHLATPLDEDELLLASMKGREAISELFYSGIDVRSRVPRGVCFLGRSSLSQPSGLCHSHSERWTGARTGVHYRLRLGQDE